MATTRTAPVLCGADRSRVLASACALSLLLLLPWLASSAEAVGSGGPQTTGATPPGSCQTLEVAARTNNLAETRRLLASGADPNAKGERQAGPLMWAAMTGATDVAQLLIASGADVNAVDVEGFNALHGAAYWTHRRTVEVLVGSGADVNAANPSGWTPLHKSLERLTECDPCAEATDAVEIARILVSHGARVNAATARGVTALHVAAAAGSVPALELLLAGGADINAQSVEKVTPLYAATKSDRIDAVRVLIERGAEVDRPSQSGRTPLSYAAYTGNLAIVEMLIARGANVKATNENGWSALDWALSMNLRVGTEFGRAEMARLRAGLSEAERSEMDAELKRMRKQWREVALYLIAHGADVNGSADRADSPMYLASSLGDEDVVAALLDRGAAPSPARTCDCESPLHSAIAEKHLGVAALLVRRGANPNDRNISLRTPLHFLARDADDPELAELLIEHGALVNAEDKYGNTPLDFSIAAGHLEVANVLRKHGGKRHRRIGS